MTFQAASTSIEVKAAAAQVAIVTRTGNIILLCPNMRVLVNNFQWCQCGHFSGHHVSVHTYETLLKKANAIAFSYGIGDFDREVHSIGHDADDPSRRVTVQLGSEWNVSQFITILSQLSTTYKAIWFDQFSIIQKEDEIRRQLERIPMIYATFDVLALLPNPPCKCLSDAVSVFEKQEISKKEEQPFTGEENGFGRIAQKCINAVPFYSYFSRLWDLARVTLLSEVSYNLLCWRESTLLARRIEKLEPRYCPQ